MLAAGIGAALALVWAGVMVHGNVASAGEAAIQRLSGVVADTVVAEWERMLRDPERPVEPAGEVFRWDADEPLLQPLELRERWGPPEERNVFDTLLAEAERQELVEEDLRKALELVLEALEKEPAAEHRPEGILRAIQLAAKLGETEIAWTHWELAHDELDGRDARDGIPYLCLAWLAMTWTFTHEDGEPLTFQRWVERMSQAGLARRYLDQLAELEGTNAPQELQVDLLRLDLEEDRVRFGPDDASHFEASPLVRALLSRMGKAVYHFDEQRACRALERLAGTLPRLGDDGCWHPLEVAGRSFLARAKPGGETEGFFHSPGALSQALTAGAHLPEGFALDFAGDAEDEGAIVRARTRLGNPASSPADASAAPELCFVLRHADPGRIARAEAARLGWLRAALFVLAAFCAAGGFFTSRALRRERKLGELKSAFVAGVSHDLRTPLASILLLSENLESGRASEENRARYHRSLRREAERLRRLVEDVLDFSRLERGEAARLVREDVDLPRFLSELAGEIRERVEEAGRPFALAAGDVPPCASLDGVALRRAVLNLVDNALKHGAGEVRLSWESGERRWRVRVSDGGPGVPPARREAIFRPFERFPPGAERAGHAAGGNGRAPLSGGIGLGLAIVRSIARAHGGEARVSAGAGGAGASFEIELPLVEPVEV